MKTECPHEQDVLDALAAQRWPERCDSDLRTHVSGCALCSDLVEVASALLGDRESAWKDARVPPAQVVLWRAQVRAREDAVRAAARPLAFIQGVAASVAVWLAVAIARAVPWSALTEWRQWVTSILPSIAFRMPDLSTLVTILTVALILLVVAAWLTPFAIYFAANDE